MDKQSTSFESIGVAKWLATQCNQIGLRHPTPVQINCIPKILEGRDVLGCAKTGTGKTLAFALPIIQDLSGDPYGVFALVLTPTRELAFQIADQFSLVGKPMSLRALVVCGGRDQVLQASELDKRPHIVVATPGRLSDILSSSSATRNIFSRLRYLVLDEGDRLLAGQYGDQLTTIFDAMPKRRRTLLFSATLTDALDRLHQVSVKKPFFYQQEAESITVAQLEQRYVLCPSDVKDAYLVYVVGEFIDKNPASSVLIFTHTCRECQALTGMFRQLGTKCAPLHSMIPQRERLSALDRFRAARVRILLCTDVAARGLDIPHVDLVISHNMPLDPSTYVHRVGRSARAGRYGASIAFVTQYDVTLVHAVESKMNIKLEPLKVSDAKVARHVTEVLVAKRQSEIRLDKQKFGAKREIQKRKQMIAEGLTPEEVDKAMANMKERRAKLSVKRLQKTEQIINKQKNKNNSK